MPVKLFSPDLSQLNLPHLLPSLSPPKFANDHRSWEQAGGLKYGGDEAFMRFLHGRLPRVGPLPAHLPAAMAMFPTCPSLSPTHTHSLLLLQHSA